MNLKKILVSVFPFLFNEVTREWESLSTEDQQALIHSGQIGQIIKETIKDGEAAVVSAISTQLGISVDDVNTKLIALFTVMGFDLGAAESSIEAKVAAGIVALQAKLDAGLSDPEWDSLWEGVTGAAVSLVSHAPVDWLGLLEVVGKFVYDKFIKKN